MKHPSIKELFDYWNARRGRRVAPDRGDIEPGAIRRVLADTFILSFDARTGHPFRVAGTRVCAMFGRELKNEAYAGLWTPDCRKLALDLLAVVAHEAVGVVSSAKGAGTDGAEHELELLLLPLSHRGSTDSRVLGALAPSGDFQWLGLGTLGALTLGTLRYLGPERGADPEPRLVPDLPAARIRRGFVVYDGGQP